MNSETECETLSGEELFDEALEPAKQVVTFLRLTLPESILSGVVALEIAKHTILCLAQKEMTPEMYAKFREDYLNITERFNENQEVLELVSDQGFVVPIGNA